MALLHLQFVLLFDVELQQFQIVGSGSSVSSGVPLPPGGFANLNDNENHLRATGRPPDRQPWRRSGSFSQRFPWLINYWKRFGAGLLGLLTASADQQDFNCRDCCELRTHREGIDQRSATRHFVNKRLIKFQARRTAANIGKLPMYYDDRRLEIKSYITN